MFRTVLSISVVLFGIVFFQSTAECFDEHEYYTREDLSTSERARQFYVYVTTKWPANEIWARMSETMTIIGEGNETMSQAAIDKLVADYSGNQYLPWALLETGTFCRLINKPQTGLELNQRVINNWPSHDSSMWSLREVAMLNIELGNIEAAQTATNTVFTNFAQSEWTASVGNEIAEWYIKFGKYEEAKQVCQYIVEHWPDNYYTAWTRGNIEQIDLAISGWTLTETQIHAQRDLAMSWIHHDMMDDAQTIIDQLVADGSIDPRVANAIFKIGLHCQQEGKYEKGLELHQYLGNTRPRHPMALWSQSCVAICHIGLGNMQAAEAATNKLLADFPMNVHMANCLYDIAQQYHRFNHHEKARQYFQSVLDSWPECKYATWAKIGLARSYIGLGDGTTAESIVDGLITTLNADFPAGTELSANAAQNYCYAGGCYGQLEIYEKSIQAYQRVVNDCPDYENAWYALFRVGRNYQNLKWARRTSKSQADAKTKAAFEQLINNYPDCPGVSNAQAWLNRFASQQKKEKNK